MVENFKVTLNMMSEGQKTVLKQRSSYHYIHQMAIVHYTYTLGKPQKKLFFVAWPLKELNIANF